ncbi:T9SS type A sorting domain-containing protein [Maribellus sp. CM-23]|uniref:Ig-like domain-containing protein n=1 Tax=Maribellus sp. CM-23 TaxID=2781026 RepID=UPI001F466B63|nr:T9SS type A sorting domain-containing protein [Maribellus sp. CM-23]MCE4566178.1 T9SS type A sorting domain-containing protein [Maribellus sp. CM-23]
MFQKIHVIWMLALAGLVYGYKPVVANPLLFPENIEGTGNDVKYNVPPVAQNDTFVYYAGCDGILTGDILANDWDENEDSLKIYFAITPRPNQLFINDDRTFSIQIPEWYSGTMEFDYYVEEKTKDRYRAMAKVIIEVIPDSDCDGVVDFEDLDKDNDGIPDFVEGDGAIDSDGDGIPDSKDIDSDNDGITDNVEWQGEEDYVAPLNVDANNNGWDDAYDPSAGGKYALPVDTDSNGVPDYLDADADGDGVSDLIEAFDVNNDGFSDVKPHYQDNDGDGLDDAFDSVDIKSGNCNPTGSNCVLIDFNKNGVRDWRDLSNRYFGVKSFVFPNPLVNQFRLVHPELKTGEPVDVRIFSIDGKLLFRKELTSSPNFIQIPEFTEGVYRILVHSNSFTNSQNIIIAR